MISSLTQLDGNPTLWLAYCAYEADLVVIHKSGVSALLSDVALEGLRDARGELVQLTELQCDNIERWDGYYDAYIKRAEHEGIPSVPLIFDHHYFASSVAEWRTDGDLTGVLEGMQRQPFPFAVARVDLPIDAPYSIQRGWPDLDAETVTLIGEWDVDARGIHRQVR